MHHKIEHNLDTIMLFREESRLPSAFSVDEALPDDPRALEAAARMLRFALAELCPDKNISAGKLLEAFRDSKLSSRLLMDRKGRKRRLLLGAEKRLPGRVELSGFICPDQPDTDWDYPNLAHRPWVDQGKGGGAVRTDDFFQIFDGCAVTAADLCIQFAEAVETKLPVDFLSAYDFHNGGM